VAEFYDAAVKAGLGLQLNEHIIDAGDIVFRHACKLGYEAAKLEQDRQRARTYRERVSSRDALTPLIVGPPARRQRQRRVGRLCGR
jgi:hypothetical protein